MHKITDRSGFGIGRMSQLSKVNIETIRYYERIAIMPEPDRTSGGNRQYGLASLKRLSFIRRCRELGFSLDEIRNLLTMVDRHDFTCSQIHQMTIEHLKTIKAKLSQLKRLQNSLTIMASECSKGDIPDCPIIDALFDLD